MRHVLAGIIGLLLLTGCQGLGSQQRLWLDQGEQAYAAGQYTRCIEQLSRFLTSAPNTPEAERAAYVRGLAQIRSGRRLAGRNDLNRCAQTASNTDVRWRALTVLGTLDYEDQQWGTAGRSYAAAAQIAPRLPPTDIILFRLGVCYERTGQWSYALIPYRRILTEFPTSSVVADAQRRLQLRADHFSVQCGVFSSQENAQQMVNDLRRRGFDAQTRVEPRGGVRMNVVLVGKFARYDEAVREWDRVRSVVPKAVLWP
ncbi:MAG: SPOR domain-containing protein [Phycisphaerae bacterium]|jgi:tetratricopeptide (TPR) repeat protein